MASYGNYGKRITEVREISELDLSNPWNFFKLLDSDDKLLLYWLRQHQLVSSASIQCPKCGAQACWRPRTTGSHKLGGVFLCKGKKLHSTSTLHNSFFDNIKLDVRDVLLFVKLYLDGLSLKAISIQVGMNYKRTAVNWGSMTREIMVDKIYRCLPNMKLSGDIEIDESLFGRKVKHNRGARKGSQIWIFGMVQRGENKLILYPVSSRSRETLLPIIKRHVVPGSRIFSDGWSAYLTLNKEGYQHFVVNHKTSFIQTYKNLETKKYLTVNTNTIEGAWKHAKARFKAMNGVRGLGNFQSHLCEVIYRHMYKGDYLLAAYLDDLRLVYSLTSPPKYSYQSPIFETLLQSGEEFDRTRVESVIENHEDLSEEDVEESDPFLREGNGGYLTATKTNVAEVDEPNFEVNMSLSDHMEDDDSVFYGATGGTPDSVDPVETENVQRIPPLASPTLNEPKAGPSTAAIHSPPVDLTLSDDESAQTASFMSHATPSTSYRGKGKQPAKKQQSKRKQPDKPPPKSVQKSTKPRYERTLACPSNWRPVNKKINLHVDRTFADSDDDFI